MPTLRLFRQQEYYDRPRFHASFAWALLKHAGEEQNAEPISAGAAESLTEDVDLSPDILPGIELQPTSPPRPAARVPAFPTIPRFPPTLVSSLNAELSSALVAQLGGFDVSEIRIKIGKDVFTWRLGG